MFEKLSEMLKKTSGGFSFDPASLNDSVAMETEWTPAKYHGTSYRTHKLVAVSSDRFEFRGSIEAKLLYISIMVAGIGMPIVYNYVGLFVLENAADVYIVGSFFAGLMLTGFGGVVLYLHTAPIVFDKRNGYFWKGRKSPDHFFDKSALKSFAPLEQIYAIQLISEYCHSGDRNSSSYYSYELNLVLKDGKRINVIDHRNLNAVRKNACTLSEFLKVPIWDAV